MDVLNEEVEDTSEAEEIESSEEGTDSTPDGAREAIEAAIEQTVGEGGESATEAPAGGHDQTAEGAGESAGNIKSEAVTDDTPRPVAKQAPMDWAPDTKAKWGELPADVQESIHAREVAVNQMFQETANDRRTAQSMYSMAQAFAPVFAAEGVQDPMQGIQGLLNITATLQQGVPVQKAERIAGLIKHYGVDITALDNILSDNSEDNEPQQQQQQQAQQMQQMLDQRLAPVDQLVQQANQAQQYQYQQQHQQTNQTIEQFAQDPANTHFDAVRTVMADFVDLAAANGQQLSLKEAYDRACAATPAIANQMVQQRGNQVANKQRAASSISGRRASSDSQNSCGTMGVHDTLSAVWDDMTG